MNIKNVYPVCPECGGKADCDTIDFEARIVHCEYCTSTYGLDDGELI